MLPPPELKANQPDQTNSLRSVVIVPTYNEIENLPRLISSIHEHLPSADILVVDDNSPDGTGRWCEERSSQDLQLQCLRRVGTKGYGASMIEGFEQALEVGYEIILTMDADFSHSPASLPALVAALTAGEPCDVIIGSRYTAGGRIEGWPWRRHFQSRAINWLARWLLSLRPRDCSGGFRGYRASSLREIDLSSIDSTGYSILQDLLWRLVVAGAIVHEYPVCFVDRELGSSKLGLSEAVLSVTAIVRLGMTNWLRRPKTGRGSRGR